jgi:DNA (cytosine-5)-methyltransferase 1
MGFPKSFKLPVNLANSQLYKQAGNAVVVPVIKRIANEIMKAIN